jgi:hypothetical protein
MIGQPNTTHCPLLDLILVVMPGLDPAVIYRSEATMNMDEKKCIDQ